MGVAESHEAGDMTQFARPEAEFLLYTAEDGRTRIEVRFDGETAWLSLGQMAELFQRDKSVISRHIKNIFEEGELGRAAVVAESATTAADGKTYQVEYFNLDVIISVGYRVRSPRGTQFRIWATQRLREYIVKGFMLDDEGRCLRHHPAPLLPRPTPVQGDSPAPLITMADPRDHEADPRDHAGPIRVITMDRSQ